MLDELLKNPETRVYSTEQQARGIKDVLGVRKESLKELKHFGGAAEFTQFRVR